MKREREIVRAHTHVYMCFVWAHACFSYMSLAREDAYFLQICVYFDLCEFCCIV